MAEDFLGEWFETGRDIVALQRSNLINQSHPTVFGRDGGTKEASVPQISLPA